jgi:hypothetical protein
LFSAGIAQPVSPAVWAVAVGLAWPVIGCGTQWPSRIEDLSTRQEEQHSVSEDLAVVLVQLYDESAPNTEVGLAFHREELARRAADRSAAAMKSFGDQRGDRRRGLDPEPVKSSV